MALRRNKDRLSIKCCCFFIHVNVKSWNFSTIYAAVVGDSYIHGFIYGRMPLFSCGLTWPVLRMILTFQHTVFSSRFFSFFPLFLVLVERYLVRHRQGISFTCRKKLLNMYVHVSPEIPQYIEGMANYGTCIVLVPIVHLYACSQL